METQAANARQVADFLKDHPKVEKLYYLGHLEEGSEQYRIRENNTVHPGAIAELDVKGLKLSDSGTDSDTPGGFLGSTESLAEHPATMTHADVSPADKLKHHISEKSGAYIDRCGTPRRSDR